LRPAAASGITFSQQRIYYRRGAAHPGFHVKRLCWTIFAAGATFHAGVALLDKGALSVHLENLMRAHFQAHAASRAFVFI